MPSYDEAAHGDVQLANTYRVTLATTVGPTRVDLLKLVRLRGGADAARGVVALSPIQRVWLDRVADGRLT